MFLTYAYELCRLFGGTVHLARLIRCRAQHPAECGVGPAPSLYTRRGPLQPQNGWLIDHGRRPELDTQQSLDRLEDELMRLEGVPQFTQFGV